MRGFALTCLVLAACASVVRAETPEEKTARVAAEKAAADAKKAALVADKASRAAWKKLKGECDKLVRKDFSGWHPNYWHTSIDRARALYEAALTNTVFLDREKISIYGGIASCRLEATRDEDGAVAAAEAATRLPNLSEDDRKTAEEALQKMLVRVGRAPYVAPEPGKKSAKKKDPPPPKTVEEQLAELKKWTEREAASATNDFARQARLDCPWWQDAPHDIRGIVESDFYRKSKKGLLVHRYGGNLQTLLETDAALVGREITDEKGNRFRPSEVFAFCDAVGVKILLRAFVENMTDIRNGDSGAPGYEAYLATGIDDPYHCLMIDSAEGGKSSDLFVTQYDNGSGYRRLRLSEGVRIDNLYLDDSVATLISVSWEKTFMSIPSKSPAWYFEAISWANGGRSWGGTVSVHQRSTFGELRFTGVGAKELTAIKRQVLFAAKRVWNAARSSSDNGYLEVWSDPELGDQAFYLAEVKPLADRINVDAAKVRKGLPDEEVDGIYDRIAETMLNVNYILARMRTRWLEHRLTGSEP